MKLYQFQLKAVIQGTECPHHWIGASLGIGARAVQAELATIWARQGSVLVIAPLALHGDWRRVYNGDVVTPYWVGTHPEARADAVIVDALGAPQLPQAIERLVRRASRASVRKIGSGSDTAITITPFIYQRSPTR